jgi:NitT/TauT family transport system permease protein
MSSPLIETERAGAELEAGLDALETEVREPRPSLPTRLARTAVPAAVGVLTVLTVWQAVVWLYAPANLPSPAEVAEAAGSEWRSGRLQEAVLTSLERGLLGFAAALAIATPLGVLLARVPLLRRAFGPIVTGLQSLPSIAWVPLGILWFGLSETTFYFVILMGAVPSIVNGTLNGLDQVPPLLIRVGHVLGARGVTLARHVLLPAALPGYLGGLRQGWAFSWRSLMAAELIVRSSKFGLGLGGLLEDARQLFDVPGVVVGILAILLVGLAVELLFFAPLEQRVLRRRGLLVGKR